MKRTKKITAKISYIKKTDIFIIVTVFIMFIILAFGIYDSTNRYQKSQVALVSESMKILSDNQKIPFENYISDKVEVLSGIAMFSQIYNMNKEEQRNFLFGHSHTLGFHHIFIVDTDGMAYYINENYTRDQSKEAFFENIMHNDIYITEPFYGSDITIMTVCVPIFDNSSNKVGVLCGAIELDQIEEVFSQSSLMLDGESFLVNRQGCYLTNNDMQLVYDRVSIFNDSTSDYSLVRRAFSSKSDMSGVIIRDGVEYQANVKYLKDYDWAIVQCISTDAILVDLQDINLWHSLIFVILSIIFLCVTRMAISWRKSERLLATDTLTECSSRAAMEKLINKLDREHYCDITVIYMDLNKFKHVNDVFGHDAGDHILCIFSQILIDVFSGWGYVGRMGGDEFMVILPKTSEQDILQLCTEVNRLLEEESKHLNLDCIVSTSYGYSTRKKGDHESLQTFITKSDERMYKYKEEHRSLEEDT